MCCGQKERTSLRGLRPKIPARTGVLQSALSGQKAAFGLGTCRTSFRPKMPYLAPGCLAKNGSSCGTFPWSSTLRPKPPYIILDKGYPKLPTPASCPEWPYFVPGCLSENLDTHLSTGRLGIPLETGRHPYITAAGVVHRSGLAVHHSGRPCKSIRPGRTSVPQIGLYALLSLASPSLKPFFLKPLLLILVIPFKTPPAFSLLGL